MPPKASSWTTVNAGQQALAATNQMRPIDVSIQNKYRIIKTEWGACVAAYYEELNLKHSILDDIAAMSRRVEQDVAQVYINREILSRLKRIHDGPVNNRVPRGPAIANCDSDAARKLVFRLERCGEQLARKLDKDSQKLIVSFGLRLSKMNVLKAKDDFEEDSDVPEEDDKEEESEEDLDGDEDDDEEYSEEDLDEEEVGQEDDEEEGNVEPRNGGTSIPKASSSNAANTSRAEQGTNLISGDVTTLKGQETALRNLSSLTSDDMAAHQDAIIAKIDSFPVERQAEAWKALGKSCNDCVVTILNIVFEVEAEIRKRSKELKGVINPAEVDRVLEKCAAMNAQLKFGDGGQGNDGEEEEEEEEEEDDSEEDSNEDDDKNGHTNPHNSDTAIEI